MPDLADLDHTWSELEARADTYPLAQAATTPPPLRRNRHLALVVGAGATVAAVAVGAVVLGARSPSAGPSPRNTAGHQSVAPATTDAVSTTAAATLHHRRGGWTTLPTGHYLVVLDNWPGARFRSVIGVGTPETKISDDDTYQEVQIASPQGGFVVKVNPNGGWAPTGGRQVTIDERPAFYKRFLLHPEIPNHPVHPRVALAWQYAPGSWATIASTSMTPIPLDTAEQLIPKFRIAVGDPIPSPPPQGD
jgi:hypothetical protein